MIELKEVTKEYSKGIAALNGVNLKVEKGDVHRWYRPKPVGSPRIRI